jgi:hypothetical protein
MLFAEAKIDSSTEKLRQLARAKKAAAAAKFNVDGTNE